MPKPEVHYDLGPSQFKKRHACPASRLHEKNFGLKIENENSERGKKLHAILASQDEVEIQELMRDLDETDMHALQIANVEKERIIEEAGEAEIHRETWLDLSFVHSEIGGGTADLIAVKPFESAILLDYKFGQQRNLDAAQDNDQTKLYAIGVWKKFEVDEVKTILVMPDLNGKSEHTWNAYDLARMEHEYAQRVAEILASPFRFRMGDHCQFCSAKALCPVQIENALSIDPVRPLDMPGVLLSDFLTRGEQAKKWFSDLSQFAYLQLMNGRDIPGYGLFQGRGTRQWTKEGQELADMLNEIGKLNPKKKFDHKDFWTIPEVKSPAQIEKVLGKSEKVATAMSKLIEVKPGALVMRPKQESNDASNQSTGELLGNDQAARGPAD